MSLLMDALKKAERAKRQGLQTELAPAPEPEPQTALALEPLGDVRPSKSAPAPVAEGSPPSAPETAHGPSRLEELDAQFLAEVKTAAATRPKPQAAAPGQSTPPDPVAPAPMSAGTAPLKPRPAQARPTDPEGQSAAQNLFAAKQPEAPPRKTFAMVVSALTVLAVCGIGGYFWWQLRPKSTLVASRAPPPPATPAAMPPPAVTPPLAAVSPAPTSAATTGTPLTSRPGAPQASATANEEDDAKPAPTTSRVQPRREQPGTASPAKPESPIRVTKAPLRVNPDLTRGFDAFNRGDLPTAQADYERALQADPRNTDALHGLAAVAVRQNRLDQAEQLYRKIVEADPQDTTAASALINLRRQSDPNAAESRLKTLAADQPDLAAPHFSLGNLYARQGRWNDAQQSYFRAHNAEPDNPDIMFNLAVSLEHLRQNKLAARYYGQAIAAAETRPTGFDQAQAAARLRAIQP